MKKRDQWIRLILCTLGLCLVATPALADSYHIINQTESTVAIECATDTGSSSGGDTVAVEMTMTNKTTVGAGENQGFTCNGVVVIEDYGTSAFQCPSGQTQQVTMATGDSGMQVSETCVSSTSGGIS